MHEALADASGIGRPEGQPEPAWKQGRSHVAPPGDTDWQEYEPAIRRWEAILGRRAPAPTEIGPKGNVRLAPGFPEWMMGLPEGWITAFDFTRKDAFRLIGNGVVPLQAALAIGGLINEESDSRPHHRTSDDVSLVA